MNLRTFAGIKFCTAVDRVFEECKLTFH